MALEKGIASLVEAFIAAGRPSSRDQHIDDRRAGYIASAVLAGETETRVRVEDITLEGCTSASFHRPLPTACYPRLSTTTAAVLSAAALPPMTINCASLPGSVGAG